LRARALDLLVVLADDVEAVDVLAGRVARLLVIRPRVQREAVDSELLGAVGRGDRRELRRVESGAERRRCGSRGRWPHGEAGPGAIRRAGLVLLVDIERHALAVDEDLTEFGARELD